MVVLTVRKLGILLRIVQKNLIIDQSTERKKKDLLVKIDMFNMIDIKREGIEGVIAEAEVKATLMIVKRQPKEEEDKGQDLEIIHLMIVIEETTDAENQDIQNQDQDQILTQILMKEEGIDVEVLMIIM
jgi:hypothetical protein